MFPEVFDLKLVVVYPKAGARPASRSSAVLDPLLTLETALLYGLF